MIYEIAEIQIQPQHHQDFLQAVEKASEVFKVAKGCRSLRLEQVIESADTYRLVVGWDTVEDHMVTFRESEGFQTWRGLASPYFASPPNVTHVTCVLDAFTQ